MDKEELHKIFARNLQNMMTAHGINKTELAKRVGVSGAQVTAWTQGVHMPRSNHLAEMTELFDCLPSDLLTDKTKAPPASGGAEPEGYDQLTDSEKALVDAMISKMLEQRSQH